MLGRSDKPLLAGDVSAKYFDFYRTLRASCHLSSAAAFALISWRVQIGPPRLRVYNPQIQKTDGSRYIRSSRLSMTTCRSCGFVTMEINRQRLKGAPDIHTGH